MSKSFVAKEQAYAKLLHRTPEIVDRLGEKHPRAPEMFQCWLKDSENILSENNAPQVAEIAAIRAQLYAAQFKNSSRKQQQQTCCEHIPAAQSVVMSLYEEVNQPIKEARKLLAPLLAAIVQSRSVVFEEHENFQSFVERLLLILNQHEQLKQSMVHVNALLPSHDCLWLLADMVDLKEWPQQLGQSA